MPATLPFSSAQGTALFPSPLTHEGALTALSRAKREMRRPARSIRQIHAGVVHLEELQTVLLRHIHSGFSRLGGEAGDALLRHLLARYDVPLFMDTAPASATCRLSRPSPPGSCR